MSEIKNTMDWINRLDRTEEKISDPKDIERETSKNKRQEKNRPPKMKRTVVSYASSSLICI